MNAANTLVRVQRTRILHPNSLTPKDVAPHAYLWNSDQLSEMLTIIGGLLNAQGIQCTGDVAEVPKSKHRRPAKSGYFETKLIRGFGPYIYLRYWQSGHRRSVYLGKANEESNDADGECNV